MKNKLQNSEILSFVLKFDIIWLLEIKSTLQRSVPGFNVYVNKSKEGEHRGGIMMLVKCVWVQYITRIDMETEGQIWIEMSCFPGLKLGGVYVPPDDSPYFDPLLIGTLNAHIKECKQVIVLGDYNARVGNPCIFDKDGSAYEYRNTKDLTVNNTGRTITNLCNDNAMVVANHLKYENKHFGGGLSFRKREWISEIDLCLIKQNIIDILKEVNIFQDIRGSDHAPLGVTLEFKQSCAFPPEMLLDRSKSLGSTYFRPRSQSIERGPSYSV